MPGDDQANALIDGWVDTQRRMWDAWAEATRASSSADDIDAGPWADLLGAALKAWAQEVLPLARAAAETVAQGGERMAESVDLAMRAWRAMLPADGDWTAVAGRYVEQMSQLLLGEPANPLGELWRLTADELAGMQRAWLEAFVQDAPAGNDGDATVLRTFNDRYWDTWERTFGRLLESPNVGHSREVSQKSLAAMRAWVKFRRAATEYQLMLGDSLGRAWSAFQQEVVERVERGETPGTAGELLRLWGQTVDRVLTEAFAQEAYARAQGQLLNAAMGYRRAEREVVDLLLQMSHVPSRSELDEANRSIFELKRQVRDLQKTVQQLARDRKGSS